MKLKKGLENSTQDFYYDLTAGGYLKPEEMCESQEDVKKVREAIETLENFKNSCEEQIDNFFQ